MSCHHGLSTERTQTYRALPQLLSKECDLPRLSIIPSAYTPTHQRTRARMYTHMFSTSSRSTPVSTLRLRNSDQPSQFRPQPADRVSHLRNQKAQVRSRPPLMKSSPTESVPASYDLRLQTYRAPASTMAAVAARRVWSMMEKCR